MAEGLNVLWGEQMNNKPMSTLIFWLIVLIAVLVIVRTMHSNKDYESLINAMQGRLLTFDNVVYIDRNENNDFKNACIKGIILCFSWYTGLLFVYFYIKTLFWLLLLFVIPYLFTLANGALKPESSSTKIVYRNIVE